MPGAGGFDDRAPWADGEDGNPRVVAQSQPLSPPDAMPVGGRSDSSGSSAGEPPDLLATQAGWPGDSRLLETIAGAFLVFSAALPGMPIGFPLRYVAVGVLILVAVQRRPRWPLTPLQPYIWLLVFLLGWFAVVSANGMQSAGASDWVRRMVRIVLVLGLVAVAASGRIHLPSIIRGYAAGLVVNAVAFYLHLTPRPYGDLLTGYVGDKNGAALQYVVGGLLLMTVLTNKWQRVAAFLLFSWLVFLTGSRTTMAGMAAAAAWYFLLSRRHVVIRVAGGVGMIWLLQYAEENLARIGIFADRGGTDWFRQQIAEAVQLKLAVTPPQGLGLGEAYVALGQGDFYFHNSFHTMLVEGGYVALFSVLIVTLGTTLRPLRQAPVSRRQRWVEAIAIAVLVCSWQLGEVFLTISWALMVAVGAQAELVRRSPADHGPEPRAEPPGLAVSPGQRQEPGPR